MGLMFFIMGLIVMIAFISPITQIINMAQQSDSLNCQGYIFGGNVDSQWSFNATLNGGASGSPIGCMVIKLYLPYILLVFLIGGISVVLSNRAESMFGGGSTDAYSESASY